LPPPNVQPVKTAQLTRSAFNIIPTVNVPGLTGWYGGSMLSPVSNTVILQCFDAVGWVTGRASGLKKFTTIPKFTFGDRPNLQ